jgi:hypothetical protein
MANDFASGKWKTAIVAISVLLSHKGEEIMLSAKEFLKDIRLNPEFARPLIDVLKPWRLKTYVDILVVVEENISIDPADSFGIAGVIDLIRNSKVGCMRFRVDIALRNGDAPTVVAAPTAHQHKYRGFRFNMMDGAVSVIDKYEQIWCFGFKPGNSGSPNDGEIDQPGAFPASDAELLKLSQWMKDKKGGLFGTGDHHFLGASMCRRIPRLGTMRRWTNADGVPPQFTSARIDTLRPPSPAYEPGAPGGPLDLHNTPHQGDLAPQPIQWVTWQMSFWPFGIRKRPHPVLCHPTLGPIDVMPDHAHEGLCVETAAVPLGGSYNFGGGPQPEYPNAVDGGPRPAPVVIAYGSNLGDPPYNFGKGPQPARTSNPMISVYDGHRAGVGRVATDSTWHHWMDVNIDDMKAADNNDWKKISRYFINLAVWLNPPGFSTHCLYLSAVVSHFHYPGFQEYVPGLPTRELGRSLRTHLIKHYGPCWVTQIIWDIVWERKLLPFDILRKLKPQPNQPEIDPDIFEEIVLGTLVEATMKPAEAVKKAATDSKTRVDITIPEPGDFFDEPLRKAIGALTKDFQARFESGMKMFKDIQS